MDDPLLVRGLERFSDLLGNRQRLIERHRSFRDTVGEGWTFDQLHDQATNPVGCLQTVDGRDVRMVQGRERLGFTLEAGQPVRVVRETLREDLDSDLAIEVCVCGAIDFAHAARANRGGYRVRSETHASGQSHGDLRVRRILQGNQS